ncbi:Uu.00g059730.m01.CDS01 [Anthostomella pinea]|uniref:Uu.00g059730.m01.CDS01 n=1 Tax=Anthostomella pinea TaxID=933095 RepID=A0AAI8VS68_9PEZI|nr:Uu.00g059730.m01.CDS01 [Anthostomella pinea]
MATLHITKNTKALAGALYLSNKSKVMHDPSSRGFFRGGIVFALPNGSFGEHRVVEIQKEIAEHKEFESTTVFHQLLASDMPESEKSLKRLSAEAFALLVGGTTTIQGTLTVAAYYILADKQIEDRLRGEQEQFSYKEGTPP